MSKRTVIKILLDKVILILVALILLVVLVGAGFLLEDYLHLSEEWTMFVFNSFGYITVTLYLAFTVTFKEYPKTANSFVILFLIIGITLIGVFLTFHLKIIPMPKSEGPYGIGIIILSTLTILLFEYLLGFLKCSK